MLGIAAQPGIRFDRKKRGSPARPLSLYPMDFDSAMEALLQVKPTKNGKAPANTESEPDKEGVRS
jgi:hypothetical protein